MMRRPSVLQDKVEISDPSTAKRMLRQTAFANKILTAVTLFVDCTFEPFIVGIDAYLRISVATCAKTHDLFDSQI